MTRTTSEEKNYLVSCGHSSELLEHFDSCLGNYKCRICKNLLFDLDVFVAGVKKASARSLQAPEPALKLDDGKLRYDLLSPEFEEQMAVALTHGAKKYDDRNYLNGDGLELKRPLAALRRHLAELLKGQDVDDESKAHHAACVAVNAMFLYDLMTKKGRKF